MKLVVKIAKSHVETTGGGVKRVTRFDLPLLDRYNDASQIRYIRLTLNASPEVLCKLAQILALDPTPVRLTRAELLDVLLITQVLNIPPAEIMDTRRVTIVTT